MKVEASSAVQRCIDAYYQAYVVAYNFPEWADAFLEKRAILVQPDDTEPRLLTKDDMVLPIIKGGKEGKHLKEMIAAWGEKRVLDLCREFPTSTHPRAMRSDRSLSALYREAQFLIIGAQTPDDRTARNRDAVARATGETQRRLGAYKR